MSVDRQGGRPFSCYGRPSDRPGYPVHYHVHVCAHRSTGRSTGSAARPDINSISAHACSHSFWLLISSLQYFSLPTTLTHQAPCASPTSSSPSVLQQTSTEINSSPFTRALTSRPSLTQPPAIQPSSPSSTTSLLPCLHQSKICPSPSRRCDNRTRPSTPLWFLVHEFSPPAENIHQITHSDQATVKKYKQSIKDQQAEIEDQQQWIPENGLLST